MGPPAKNRVAMSAFKKEVVIDCRQHLLGRLASTLAKELLNGQHIVCVRCEDIAMSGSIFRRKIVYGEFKRKTMNSNPRRGHIHYRSPSKILWRTIRGMVPHKTARGAAALDRLKTFEGIPHPYDAKKRVVVPAALKVLRLRPHRLWTKLGDLSTQVGWHCQQLLERLESPQGEELELLLEKEGSCGGEAKGRQGRQTGQRLGENPCGR